MDNRDTNHASLLSVLGVSVPEGRSRARARLPAVSLRRAGPVGKGQLNTETRRSGSIHRDAQDGQDGLTCDSCRSAILCILCIPVNDLRVPVLNTVGSLSFS